MRDPAAEPVRHAVMYQNWCDLTFLHWRYPLDVVRQHVPPPLEVEDFEGTAWIGITPFFLRGLRPPGFPSLPWISNFPETNCRTYVRGPDGHSGIWFFSLDAARLAAVAGARVTYGLPYAWSRMEVTRSGSQIVYHSARTGPLPTASTDIIVEPGATIEAQPLERFLTARFRLYSFVLGQLVSATVEHEPWPLQTTRAVKLVQTILPAAGLPDPQESAHVMFSRGVHVRIAAPKRVA